MVEVDYSFLKTGLPDDVIKAILLALLRPEAYSFASVVAAKGREDEVVTAALLRWLQEAGIGDTASRLRSDSEASIRAFAQEVANRRMPAKTLIETAPVRSSGSMGGVERFSESLAGLVRTIRLATEKEWKTQVKATSPLFPWLVRHCSWLLNRYQLRHHGLTAFEEVQKRAYRGVVQAFASPVLGRRPQALELPKLERRWIPGLYLGKRTDSDECIIGSARGVFTTRSCKPLADHDPVMMTSMTWTP